MRIIQMNKNADMKLSTFIIEMNGDELSNISEWGASMVERFPRYDLNNKLDKKKVDDHKRTIQEIYDALETITR